MTSNTRNLISTRHLDWTNINSSSSSKACEGIGNLLTSPAPAWVPGLCTTPGLCTYILAMRLSRQHEQGSGRQRESGAGDIVD